MYVAHFEYENEEPKIMYFTAQEREPQIMEFRAEVKEPIRFIVSRNKKLEVQ